jgi:hypothetical protein
MLIIKAQMQKAEFAPLVRLLQNVNVIVDEELYNSMIIDGLLCAHYQEIIPLDY